MQGLEARTIREISARPIPLVIVCYFMAHLDRVNIGSAALTMNKPLGLDGPGSRARRCPESAPGLAEMHYANLSNTMKIFSNTSNKMTMLNF